MNGRHHAQSLSQKTFIIFINCLWMVNHFQTFMDVMDHFQSPVDEGDDLYSLHRVDPFLGRHG
jgi:hypothetical protein